MHTCSFGKRKKAAQSLFFFNVFIDFPVLELVSLIIKKSMRKCYKSKNSSNNGSAKNNF